MQELDSIQPSKLLEFILKNQQRIMPDQWAFMFLYVIDNVSRKELLKKNQLSEFIKIVKSNISKYKQLK